MEIISRLEAAALGLKQYFSGKPCKYGHVSPRQVCNHACMGCAQEYRDSHKEEAARRSKEWAAKNSDKRKEYEQNYRKEHPEKQRESTARYVAGHLELVRKQSREYARKKREENPGFWKTSNQRYADKLESIRAQEAGRPRPDKCEICDGFNNFIAFDHCHETGLFRGWICDHCNRTLGMVKDSPELLMKMRDYLVNFQSRIEREKLLSKDNQLEKLA